MILYHPQFIVYEKPSPLPPLIMVEMIDFDGLFPKWYSVPQGYDCNEHDDQRIKTEEFSSALLIVEWAALKVLQS